MATILVVAADGARRARLQRVLTGHSVLTAGSDAEAIRIARYVDLDLVVRDAADSARGLTDLADGIRQAAPRALLLVVGSANGTPGVEATVPANFTSGDMEAALARTLEKQRLLRELATMRSRTVLAPPGIALEPGWDGDALARALRYVARALAAGPDLPRVLEGFLDAVAELARPARLALLLPDPGEVSFHIVAHRGLPPPLVASVHLLSDGGLARWLRVQGRPARLADLEPEVGRELTVLHSVVAVPLLAHGELVGVLALGPPVVRSGYATHEIEILFDLSAELATAVRDITRQREFERQKEVGDTVMANLASGVVTIGRDHRVGALNRRAEQTLDLHAAEAVGRDLRILPSPLGDLLYETLVSGRALPPAELQLALNRRWLEVSTYPVPGEAPSPVGAVLVFRDITEQKAEAVVRQRAEQREVLTRVIARIADEIKNPLVSVNTFVELIEERYDDADFRKDFSAVVRRDAGRLVDVLDKLRGLVEGAELNFSIVDVREVVREFVSAAETGPQAGGPAIVFELAPDATPHPARVDPDQLRRAVGHLVAYLAHVSSGEPARIALSVGRGGPEGPEAVRVLVTSRTARVPADQVAQLFDPVEMMQESLVAVGPAVSQRIVESLGGNVQIRQGRHEIGFLITLPPAA